MSAAAGSRQSNTGRTRARRYALQALYQWQISGNDLRDIEVHVLADQDTAKIDLEYFRELLHQVPAQIDVLDAHLAPLLDRPLKEVDPVERAILRLAAYELAEKIEVPFRVVINEAVDLAKTFGAEQGHRFINGVLDKLAKRMRPHG